MGGLHMHSPPGNLLILTALRRSAIGISLPKWNCNFSHCLNFSLEGPLRAMAESATDTSSCLLPASRSRRSQWWWLPDSLSPVQIALAHEEDERCRHEHICKAPQSRQKVLRSHAQWVWHSVEVKTCNTGKIQWCLLIIVPHILTALLDTFSICCFSPAASQSIPNPSLLTSRSSLCPQYWLR